MPYIDFINKRINLHKEIVKAIINLMQEKEVTEVDLTEREDELGSAWLIRMSADGGIEEAQVVAVKIDSGILFYKGKGEEIDEDWQSLDVADDVISATNDSVYDAVFLRIGE